MTRVTDDAPPGKALKYARREFERRFLLAAAPTDPPQATIEIVDRYFTGTRLRLRHATVTEGSAPRVERKLTQKVPGHDGDGGRLTNLYLNEVEFDRLAILPADRLEKTRLRYGAEVVDLFRGPLRGLVTMEHEVDDAAALAAYAPERAVVAEVTTDERFRGGALVRTDRTRLRMTLAEYGVFLPD